jgi:hypothetical protein
MQELALRAHRPTAVTSTPRSSRSASKGSSFSCDIDGEVNFDVVLMLPVRIVSCPGSLFYFGLESILHVKCTVIIPSHLNSWYRIYCFTIASWELLFVLLLSSNWLHTFFSKVIRPHRYGRQ